MVYSSRHYNIKGLFTFLGSLILWQGSMIACGSVV